MSDTVIAAEDVSRHYRVRRSPLSRALTLRAVEGVSFTVARRKTMAVVGESGSGKSTLARLVTLIEPPTTGRLRITDRDAGEPGAKRALRRSVQMIFQDPYGSLNPRHTVGAIIGEPLRINTELNTQARRDSVLALMEKVGLRRDAIDRYPHMFSGGQRQRIAIARALILHPAIVVADEPVSALDVSVRAQVLNLMMDLQEEFDLAYLFISHDLGVVRHIADDVLVLYLGRTVEHGPKAVIFERPRHPYTRALLASTPAVAPELRRVRQAVRGEMPSPLAPPPGCAFNSRCPHATDLCRRERPALRALDERLVACHHAETIG